MSTQDLTYAQLFAIGQRHGVTSVVVEAILDDAALTRPDSAAPAGVEPVVINADYRAMWQEQVELNQRLCTALAAAPKAPAGAQEPAMPMSIVRAFMGKEREAWEHGYKTACAILQRQAPQPPSAPKGDAS